jgi:hypothetical protein
MTTPYRLRHVLAIDLDDEQLERRSLTDHPSPYHFPASEIRGAYLVIVP